ncbi:MAG: hypothetical protein ABS81_03035 [Pseudonocardia sp. SCN 72-86]|nr:MAG: hypothetical protein ABS81_03035 [Pseudonocardia sp. SCN 72-86]
MPSPVVGSRQFLRWCLRLQWRGLTGATVVGVVVQLLYVALPWAVQRALDDGVTTGSTAATAKWAGVLVAIGVALVLSRRLEQRLNYMAGAKVLVTVRQRLNDHLLTVDRTALDGLDQGDLVTRNGRDVEELWAWISGVIESVQVVVGLVVTLVAIALLDPNLALVGVATVPLLVLIAVLFRNRYERRSRVVGDSHGARADLVEGLVSAGVAVRGLGGEHVLVERHGRVSGRVTTETLRLARVGAAWSSLSGFVPLAATAVGVAVGGLAVLDGRMSLGGLVAFVTWMEMLASRVAALVGQQVTRKQAAAAGARISEVLDRAPTVRDPDDPVPLPAVGGLVATDLVVGTPDRPWGGPVSLSVGRGETVALTGPTGSGKSSILRALVRLDDLLSGTVTFAGTPLADAEWAQVRRRVGYVPQRPVLLSGTIAENLGLGLEPPPGAERLREACRAAAIDDHIDSLPEGYETLVGEGGTTLSGGQVQRLAIARALLAGTPVILLDDVTSAVDTGTEATILDGLRRIDPDVALVVVTHRPAVLDMADRVVTLAEAGSLAGQGVMAGGEDRG